MSRALKKIGKKFLLVLLIAMAAAVPMVTLAADAKTNLFNCVTNPPTCAIYGITTVLSSLGGVLITFDAFLVKLAWEFTTNVVNSPVVSQGFGVTLNLTNLGFVIGIIFIAIATIFRSQTYGVKQLLTRLVAMAILVNFSLVIAGVLINFSDQLSLYFLKASTPAGNVADMSSFVNTIVNVASPQGLLFDPPTDQGTVAKIWGFVTGLLGTDKNFLSQLAGLVFAVAFTFLFGLVLGVIGIMFFLRYFWLTFLLILMPFAWLSWVFPAFKKHWSDWWNHFIKWAFYAPALTFFLYLAVSIAQTDYVTKTFNNLGADQANNTVAALSVSVERKPNFLQNIAKEIVVVGLLFGGLVAANKAGVSVAGGALKLADSTKKWALGATGRKGVQAGTSIFRRKNAEGKSVAERTRTWAQNIKNPALRYAAGWVARGTTRLETAGTENLVKDYEKIYAGRSANDIQAALLTSLPGPARVALLKRLVKDKKMSGVSADMVLNDGTQKMMANFGQGIEFGNMEKQMMMSKEMYQAIKAGNRDGAEEAAEKFFTRFSKKDVTDMQFNDIFGNKEKFGQTVDELKNISHFVARGLANANSSLVTNIIPKLKGESGENFRKIYLEEASGDALKNFDRIWTNNAVFAGGEEAEPKAAEAPKEPAKATT